MAALTATSRSVNFPLTVVMITRNRRASAVRSVETLSDLPERPPIIVVDNASDDDTVAALRGRANVRTITAGRNLGAAGRTVGVQEANTPYVAFADDDSWWAPGALDTAARLFDEHQRLGLLAGRTLVGDNDDDDPLNHQLEVSPLGREPDLPGRSVLGFLACSAIVRRRAYLDSGGFHPRFGVGGEEGLLALDLISAGWGVAYVPEVIAHHHPGKTGDRIGRKTRMVRNDLWTTWLRRRLTTAVMTTARTARAACRETSSRRGLLQALAGLRWTLTQRRAVAPRVEEMARCLERST